MAISAQWLTITTGAWLIGLGGLMLIRPRQALAALGRMGGSAAIHIGEMAVRILVGLVLVIAAAGSRYPVAITLIGEFLIASAVVLLILPRRWHAAYSTWWADRIPVAAVRLIGPLSWLMGGALIWVVL